LPARCGSTACRNGQNEDANCCSLSSIGIEPRLSSTANEQGYLASVEVPDMDGRCVDM
jgi:hypothetical protein